MNAEHGTSAREIEQSQRQEAVRTLNVPQPIRYESDLLLFECRADTTAAKVPDNHDVLHLIRVSRRGGGFKRVHIYTPE